ncbi:MAG: TetR/AcrR family transcriptional regulator [Deltaproteobacteria bacterium]|nr:TetR/AcrR family transcriptional regulator [Candidatus Zymogenaceae bacterium]
MKRVKSKVKDKHLVDEKRKKIVDGAISVFSEKGYPNATVREIAGAAGLGLGSIYDYVKSKDDILYLFYENYMNRFYEKLSTADTCDADPKRRLLVTYTALIDVCFELEDQVMLAYTQARYMKRHYLKEILTREAEIVERFFDILTDMGIERGDADLRANFLVYSAVFGVLRRWNLKNLHDRSSITEYLIDTNLKPYV